MNDPTEQLVNKSELSASDAPSPQKGRREYRKHGDNYREAALRRHGVGAIDARSASGKQVKAWRRYALEKKGGKAATIDVKAKVDAGAFYLWRALELRAYIVADSRRRGTPINRDPACCQRSMTA